MLNCGDQDEQSSSLNFEQLFKGHNKDSHNATISYDGHWVTSDRIAYKLVERIMHF